MEDYLWKEIQFDETMVRFGMEYIFDSEINWGRISIPSSFLPKKSIEHREEYSAELIENALILDFNYTQLIKTYGSDRQIPRMTSDTNLMHVKIHGELKAKHNPIIFGYGDEIDESFNKIESTGNNQFLKQIKSIAYQKNNNYQKLTTHLESGPFDVLILGMSCGLSDRTMLKMIFEHENCIYIKPYFYEWENENGEKENNYSDIVSDISRHFSLENKGLMRNRVVVESECQPLPQMGGK